MARPLCFAALTVSCLIAVVAGGIYAWSRFAVLVFKQTEYAGLRLEMTMAETKYLKGVPTNVLEVEQAGEWQGWKKMVAINELEKGKEIEDYNEWSYEGIGHRIALVFDKNKVIVIECYSEDRLGRCPALGGIRDGDSEQELFRRFGHRNTVSIHGFIKKVRYPNVGAVFYLTQETVYMLGIIDTHYKYTATE
jgi:hypothetical protein